MRRRCLKLLDSFRFENRGSQPGGGANWVSGPVMTAEQALVQALSQVSVETRNLYVEARREQQAFDAGGAGQTALNATPVRRGAPVSLEKAQAALREAGEQLEKAAPKRFVKQASKLAALRKSKNWTQQELADQVGVTRRAVQYWEDGTNPPGGRIWDIAKAFGLSLEQMRELGEDWR